MVRRVTSMLVMVMHVRIRRIRGMGMDVTV
jgi:hypothetical protein